MISSAALEALAAHISYFRTLTERGGGTVEDAGGIVSWHSRHPMGFLVNAAIRIDPSVNAAQVLAEADRRFVTGYEVVALVGRDDDLFDLAVGPNEQHVEPDPIQVLANPAGLGEPKVHGSIVLRTVTDAGGVKDVAQVNRDATASLGFPDDLFPTIFADPASVLADDIEAVVAYADGRPIATAQVHVPGAMAYVGWVATIPTAARSGLGTLVTLEVIARACRRGAATVSLMASPMGAPIYRRIGFSDVGGLKGAPRSRPPHDGGSSSTSASGAEWDVEQ